MHQAQFRKMIPILLETNQLFRKSGKAQLTYSFEQHTIKELKNVFLDSTPPTEHCVLYGRSLFRRFQSKKTTFMMPCMVILEFYNSTLQESTCFYLMLTKLILPSRTAKMTKIYDDFTELQRTFIPFITSEYITIKFLYLFFFFFLSAEFITFLTCINIQV